MEFREFVIEWNYFAICETKKKKPGFRYNLPLSYSQKKKKKNVIFFQQATSDYTVTIAHAKKKKKTLSDTNYEGKKMYRNRKQHDICGKITRQRWLQIRALL